MPTEYEVETFTGRFVNVHRPDPDTIVIEDIAHALANTCRYGGHCQRFLSVAEHSRFVSLRIKRQGGTLEEQLGGLWHDCSEAFLNDIPRPLKPLLGKTYERLTDRMDDAIIKAIHLPFERDMLHSPIIKQADNWALFVEARHLLPSGGKQWWDGAQGAAKWDLPDQPTRIVTPDYWPASTVYPAQAEAAFIHRHNALYRAYLDKGAA